MIINLVSHIKEEKWAVFTLNMVLVKLRYLDPINLPYFTVCIDRHINLFAQKRKIHSFKSN